MIPLNTLQSMPSNYLWYRFSKIFLKIAIVSLLFSSAEGGWTDAFLAFSILLSPYLIYILLKYKYLEFQINNESIEIKSGIISKNSITIPFHSVQNVNLKSGPFQRLFDIANVRIWTSSQSQLQTGHNGIEVMSDGALVLNKIDAEQLQNMITKK